MATKVNIYANRRTATGLLKKLGKKPYEYDNFINVRGNTFEVTVTDGQPVSKMALAAAMAQVADTLTAAAESVVEAVVSADKAIEAAVAASPVQLPEETAEERKRREKQLAKLKSRYTRIEQQARKAEAPPPKPRKKHQRAAPKKKLPRKKPAPRPPCLTEEQIATYAKAIKAKSVGPAILELYLAGRTTAEVWLVIKRRFKTPDTHKHYPSWYLCHYRRAGKLPTPENTDAR